MLFPQMVCGSQTFDLAELKKVTFYDGYKKDDITVQHFWEVRFFAKAGLIGSHIKNKMPQIQHLYLMLYVVMKIPY